ncbi:MAG: HAD family hydrolase [bacterium]|nr:HAD family hydrolase [bacterium]
MQDIKAVIFDLDGTLYDGRKTQILLMKCQYGLFNLSKYFKTETDYVDQFLIAEKNGHRKREDVYSDLCGDNKMLADTLLADYNKYYALNSFFRDSAKEILLWLKSHNYKLGLVTNGCSVWQRRKIESLNIKCFFKSIKISEEEGIGKPDPEIFKRCMTELNVTPKQSIYIGDHPIYDMKAADAIGMKTAWVKNIHYDSPNCKSIHLESLMDLAKILG